MEKKAKMVKKNNNLDSFLEKLEVIIIKKYEGYIVDSKHLICKAASKQYKIMKAIFTR